MVRNYIRKTDRGSKYSKALLLEAIAKIKSKEMNCYEASNHYKIPKTTLHDHVVGKRGRSFTLGKPPVLPNDVEEILAANLLEIERNGFNFSRKEKLELVGRYLRTNKVKTPFKRDVPGECWWSTFGKRHGLTGPTTKALLVDFGRPKERDVIVIKEYYSTLKSKINELALADKPGQIWHIEEHSFYGGKRVANADKNKDVTVVTALSAEGKKAPLLTVLKGEESQQWLLGQQVLVSHSLGMCRDVFKDYFTTIFLNYIDDSRPSIVIYDGQSAHIDLDLINDARKAKISMIKSPSYLDGLGISVTNVLKQKWGETSSTSLEEFKTVVADAFCKLEVFEIEESFKSAGVHPFDAVCDSKFDGARLLVYDEFQEYKINHTLRDEPEQVIMEEDLEFQMSLKIEPEDSSTSFDIDVGSMFEPEETKVQEYSQADLKQAMMAVKKGLTFIEISPHPEFSLKEPTPAVYSGARKLTIAQENQLVIWLEDLTDAGFMATKKYLADAVNNLITDFGRVPLKNKDRHLYKGFLKRHPELADRVKESTEFTEDALKSRFDHMQRYIKERNLEDILNDPRRIFNCGDTVLQLRYEENRAIDQNMLKVNANDLTIVVAASADGNIQTPSVFFTFKGVKKESVVSWTKGDFLSDQIIDVFHPWLIDREIPLPVILFVDHTTHINLHLLDFCKENQIILIALPDCRLQPLETVFRLMKQWEKEQTVIQKLKKDDLAKELVSRIKKDFNSEISNGFKMCGLYPFDLKIGYDKIGQKTQS